MAYEFYLGVDTIPDSNIFTLALIEKSKYLNEQVTTYHVRRLEQRDNKNEEELARHIQNIIAVEPFNGRTRIVVNVTGKPGRRLVDALVGQGLTPVGVTITGGDSAAQSGPGIVVGRGRGPNNEAGFIVSEHDLVETAEELYRDGQLKLEQDTDEVSSLAHGLEDYIAGAPEAGVALRHIAAEPRRDAAHNSLVLGAALACWYGEQISFTPGDHLKEELPETQSIKRAHRPDVTT